MVYQWKTTTLHLFFHLSYFPQKRSQIADKYVNISFSLKREAILTL